MKKLYSLFVFICFFSLGFLRSQTNLVPNAGFEIQDTCPNTISQISYALPWNALYESPDYYNSCVSSSSIWSVPYNFLGYQYAAAGNAYAGFWVFSTTSSNYREIIGTQLTTPLAIGQKYYVKLTLNLALGYNSNSGADKTGLRFTNIQHTQSNPPSINNTAHIYSSSIIIDTLNWTTVFGSFIADSSYSFIEVGNFFDDANTHIQSLRFQTADESYYYLDDICVSTDSLFSLGWHTTSEKINAQKEIKLYPNPSTDGYFYLNANFSNEEIDLYDLLGNQIKKINISGNIIDLSNIDNGIYFIAINNKQYSLKEKIIINK